jgi:hypothetical protein
MDIPQTRPASWEEVLSFARRLEQDARTGSVAPTEGAALVLLVLDFHAKVAAMGVRRRLAPQEPAAE